jgi:hypothetical protein
MDQSEVEKRSSHGQRLSEPGTPASNFYDRRFEGRRHRSGSLYEDPREPPVRGGTSKRREHHGEAQKLLEEAVMARSDSYQQYAQDGNQVDPLDQLARSRSQYTTDRPVTTQGDYSFRAPQHPYANRPARGGGILMGAGGSVAVAGRAPG